MKKYVCLLFYYETSNGYGIIMTCRDYRDSSRVDKTFEPLGIYIFITILHYILYYRYCYR